MSAQRKPHAPTEAGGGTAVQAGYAGCSTARLYAAVIRVPTELGFTIVHRDDATMSVSFRPHGPTTSWPVQGLTAAVRPQEDGARVIVGAGLLSGPRLLMSEWHQAKAVALMFIQHLTDELPRVPEPEPAPSAPPQRSNVELLKTLADLRDRGLLTEDEFAEEKRRLLS
jgi:hypothetical protein